MVLLDATTFFFPHMEGCCSTLALLGTFSNEGNFKGQGNFFGGKKKEDMTFPCLEFSSDLS